MFSDQLFERFFFGEIVLDAVQCRSSFPFGEFPADISINNEFVPGDYERVRKSEIPLLVQCSQLERLYRQIVSGVARVWPQITDRPRNEPRCSAMWRDCADDVLQCTGKWLFWTLNEAYSPGSVQELTSSSSLD